MATGSVHARAHADWRVPITQLDGCGGCALDYRRHGILLASMVLALAVTSRWRPWPGAVLSCGLYGALHASMISASLRTRETVTRKLSFIAITAGVAMTSGVTGLSSASVLGSLAGRERSLIALALCSGVGAAGYSLVLKLFWIRALGLSAALSTTLCCVCATLAALPVGAYLGTVGGTWFAMIWWCTFSTALWCHDSRARGTGARHVRHS